MAINRDGATRRWLTPRTPLTRDLFGRGKVRQKILGEELDLMAYEEYGDSRLWYVIAEVNDIIDPVAEAIPNGTPLFIPSLSEIRSLSS